MKNSDINVEGLLEKYSSLSPEKRQKMDAATIKIQSSFHSWSNFRAYLTKEEDLVGKVLKHNGKLYKIASDTGRKIPILSNTKRNIVIQGYEDCKDHTLALTYVEDKDETKSAPEIALDDDSASGFDSEVKENAQILILEAVLDGEKIAANSAIEIRDTIDRTRSLRATSKKIHRSIEKVSEYRSLIQGYKSTLELADAYNKSNTLTTDKENPHKKHLLKVAEGVISRYLNLRNPSKEQIMELANLSGLNEESISEGIYNALIVSLLKSLKPDNLEIINLDKAEASAIAIRLLPPGFLSESHFDTILKALVLISEWLSKRSNSFKSAETDSKQIIPILRVYSEMLESLLDNKQLQKMSIVNNSMNALSKNIESSKNICVSVMLESLRNQIMSVPKTMPTLPSFNFDPMQLKSNFATAISGNGLDKGTREKLMLGISKLQNHADIEIKYLAGYIAESIARLAEKGDSNLNQLMDRSMHLILGAKSLGLIVLSSGGSINEYKPLLEHAMGALKSKGISKNKWYDQARKLLPVISESSEDEAKLRFALNELNSYYKSENNPSWQLTYILLKNLMLETDKSKDIKIKKDLLGLATRIALDTRYNIEVRKVSIVFLINAASDPDQNIRELAVKHVREDIYNNISRPGSMFSLFSSSGNRLPKDILIRMENIGAAEIRDIAAIPDDIEENEILFYAKKSAYPIEQRTSDIREQVSLLLKDSPVEESLKSYIPLTGSRFKHTTDKSQFFSLEKKVIDFVENKSLSNTPTLLIHGGAGAGKSLFARYLEQKYWNKYEQGGLIPLFISLPTLQDPSHKAIEQALSSYGFTQDDIIELRKESHKDKNITKEFWRPKKVLMAFMKRMIMES